MAEKQMFKVNANGMEFYCERRGTEGPKVILIPNGDNDCEQYDRLAVRLSDAFQTLTFDPRGGTRSMDPEPRKVTPKLFADDIAAIIKATNFEGATIWGCSSGGQAALAVGKYHPELVKNIIVHEAALQQETPLPGAGFAFFQTIESFKPYFSLPLPVSAVSMFVDYNKMMELPEEAHKRMEANRMYWAQYYLGTADAEVYSEEDYAKMPPVSFTVGTWSPSWLTQANITAAARAGASYTWFNCAHFPEIICPDEYAAYLREEIQKFQYQ